MFVDCETLFHRVGIFFSARFNFQFCIARLSDIHQAVDAGLAVRFYFDGRLLAFYRLAVNEQP